MTPSVRLTGHPTSGDTALVAERIRRVLWLCDVDVTAEQAWTAAEAAVHALTPRPVHPELDWSDDDAYLQWADRTPEAGP